MRASASARRPTRPRKSTRRGIAILVATLVVAVLFVVGAKNVTKPLPEGLSVQSPMYAGSEVDFLADLTWVDDAGTRHVEQSIFDSILDLIENAQDYVLADLFLFNAMQGPSPERTRSTTDELTDALVAFRDRRPNGTAILITDPINTVYGGRESAHLQRLRTAGVRVVTTDLAPLRDSNPLVSAPWRIFAAPFGRGEGGIIPNPFSAVEPGVSVRAWLELLNFKANHRKVVVADDTDGLTAIVGSWNPHDGSSAHGNVALRVRGSVVADIVESELAVAAMSGESVPGLPAAAVERVAAAGTSTSAEGAQEAGGSTGAGRFAEVGLITESAIQDALLQHLDGAATGDFVDVAMFYLSDRDVIAGLKAASDRGASVRLLLDPNKDAFGRTKNGVPNRPVAAELRPHAEIRWCDTHGEQCHAKIVLIRSAAGPHVLIAGSANLTRRNLDDYNLETNVIVRALSEAQVMRDAAAYFERVWANEPGRIYSAPYEAYAESRFETAFKTLLYRIMEGAGLSTF